MLASSLYAGGIGQWFMPPLLVLFLFCGALDDTPMPALDGVIDSERG
jgi:hypothetical protein